MDAQSIYHQLPEDLQIALAVAVTEPAALGHLGTDELRHLTRHLLHGAVLDSAVIEILDSTLDRWLDEQAGLQLQARDVFERLLALSDIDLESSSFPTWYTQPWVQILVQPWSEKLAEAIVDAEDFCTALSLSVDG